ncbi:MAG: hypothetical protein RR225_08430 [Clostridium sp.]
MLYTEEQKKEIERVREVFANLLKQSPDYELFMTGNNHALKKADSLESAMPYVTFEYGKKTIGKKRYHINKFSSNV